MPGAARLARPPSLHWDWSRALLGAVYAIPAAVAVFSDTGRGIAFAIGVLPAAASALAATRRGRRSTALLGVLVGGPLFLGSVVANVPWLAVITVFALAVGAALLATRIRLGQLLLGLGVPMVGIGLSYTDLAESGRLAILMVVGALYAYLVSRLWPERPEPAAAPVVRLPPFLLLGYGVRLGLAGATSAAIGFALGLDHVGWACAAALLVMRPSREMQELRSVGRIVSVAVGATGAIVMITIGPAPIWYSVAVVAAIAALAAMLNSRWYITSAYSTFLVFLLLLHSDPNDATARFNERIGETVLGVGLAYFFGLAVPQLWQVWQRRRRPRAGRVV